MNAKKWIKLPNDCKQSCWNCNKYVDCKNSISYYVSDKGYILKICKVCYNDTGCILYDKVGV